MPSEDELLLLLNRTYDDFGLEDGFYDRLSNMRDWEFVILLCSLLDASLLNGIVAILKDERVRDTISYLDLASFKCSKVELALDLDIISKHDSKFIRKIAEIRNMLAHQISHRNFSLFDYILNEGRNDKNKMKSLVKILSHRLKDNIKVSSGKSMARQDAILDKPREILLANAMDIMINVLDLRESG